MTSRCRLSLNFNIQASVKLLDIETTIMAHLLVKGSTKIALNYLMDLLIHERELSALAKHA